MKPKALSLFAGAGGLDIGVDGAGFKTVCSVELDPHCAATLRQNAREKTVWQVDVRALDPTAAANIDDPTDIKLYAGPIHSTDGEACWTDLLGAPAISKVGSLTTCLTDDQVIAMLTVQADAERS